MSVLGETRAFVDGKWRRRGRPAIDGPTAPFILGVTEPTEENTGARFEPLQTFGSQGSPYTYTISTPGVYERIRVYGKILVTAQTGVILRDVEVIMQATSVQIDGIQFNNTNAYGNLIEHSTVRVGDPETATEDQSTCIRGRGFDAYRCNFSGAVDGSQIWTSNSATERRRARYLGCYFHDFIVSASPGQDDLLTHNDCIQALGSINMEIIGCALHGGRTSCVIINTEFTFHGWGDCIIEDNWLYGHPTEGSTINFATTAAISGTVSVKRNRVDRGGHNNGKITVKAPNRVPSYFGATSGTSNGTTGDWVYGADANVYMDNGQAVPISVG